MSTLAASTIMCLIPGLTLEISKFTYKGVMEDFVSPSVLVCDFWDFGVNLWRYTPSRFYGVLFSGCYWLNNVFFPLVTFGLCTCKVLGDWRVSRRVYKFCYAMSMLDGVVISVGFSVVQIEMVSRWIFDDSISICEELKEVRGGGTFVNISETQSTCLHGMLTRYDERRTLTTIAW